jgi:hypothetical protein
MGRESTQECFDANPLMFIEDIKNGMPKDDNHPERAMLFGDGVDISYVMKLPDNIVGDMVLLQFIYWTANTCNYEGYKEYFTNNETPPSNKGNWSPSLIDCPKILPTLRGVEALTPEIFVNCAEITIQGAPTVPSPTPAPAPTPTPINQDPVEIPVTTGKLPPVDPNIVGTCGQGLIGNGICPAQTLCCSKFGYCGTVATRYVCDGRLLILLHLILLLYVFVCYVCHAFSVSHLNSLSLSPSLTPCHSSKRHCDTDPRFINGEEEEEEEEEPLSTCVDSEDVVFKNKKGKKKKCNWVGKGSNRKIKKKCNKKWKGEKLKFSCPVACGICE